VFFYDGFGRVDEPHAARVVAAVLEPAETILYVADNLFARSVLRKNPDYSTHL